MAWVESKMAWKGIIDQEETTTNWESGNQNGMNGGIDQKQWTVRKNK